MKIRFTARTQMIERNLFFLKAKINLNFWVCPIYEPFKSEGNTLNMLKNGRGSFQFIFLTFLEKRKKKTHISLNMKSLFFDLIVSTYMLKNSDFKQCCK